MAEECVCGVDVLQGGVGDKAAGELGYAFEYL